jgi:hypothetical protein
MLACKAVWHVVSHHLVNTCCDLSREAVLAKTWQRLSAFQGGALNRSSTVEIPAGKKHSGKSTNGDGAKGHGAFFGLGTDGPSAGMGKISPRTKTVPSPFVPFPFASFGHQLARHPVATTMRRENARGGDARGF